MRILIMGAGALGSLYGYLLMTAGFDVIFVARGKQYLALKERGLRVSGLIEDETRVDVERKPVNSDLVFLTVKAYDTKNAIEDLKSIRFKSICSLQNGVGNEDLLSLAFDSVVGGVTTYGANLKDFGHVVYAGKGITYVGDYKGESAEEFYDLMKVAKINVEKVKDIRRKIWEKASINAVINPLTALCRVENGKIVSIPEIWYVAERIAEECEKVMDFLGYKYPVAEEAKSVAIKTARNRSSMLQDIEKGKKTEIEFINGAFVEKALEFGFEAVYNKIMVKLIRGIEVGMG